MDLRVRFWADEGAFLTTGDAGAEAMLRRPRVGFVAEPEASSTTPCVLRRLRFADAGAGSSAGGGPSSGAGAWELNVAFSGSDIDFSSTTREGVEPALSVCCSNCVEVALRF